MGNKRNKGHLRLAHSVSEADRRREQMLRRIGSQEFTAGSWERVLKQRDFLLKYYLDVKGVEEDDIEAKHERASAAILEILQEKTHLAAEAIDREFLSHIVAHVSVNFGLVGVVEAAGDGETPSEKVEKYMDKLADYLWRVGWVMMREELGAALHEYDIQVRDSDVTRLLIWEINQHCLVPRIFVLPNDHHRYNPRLAILKGDLAVSATEARVLRAFAW